MSRPTIAAFLVLALDAGRAHATEQSQPVPLGAAGLTLELGLLKQDAPGSSWSTQSTAGVTVTDLANGEYVLAGLPTATGTIRYHVTVALDGDAERQLYTTTYGAQPGTRITWRQELQLPGQPIVFKVGDTFGSIALVVLRRLPAAACEPGTTATFAAWRVESGAQVWTGRTAVISDCILDGTTGSYGATFTYDLQSGDTATVGRYLGEFKICYSPTSCHTLPADNRLEWRVNAAF